MAKPRGVGPSEPHHGCPRGRRPTDTTTHARPARAGRNDAERPADALARVLGDPHLARLVPHLAPETLHAIIRHRGLDACEEIVLSATSAQIASLFDLDLWRSAEPGQDERFDVARFGEWVALLVEAGDAAAARMVDRIDRTLLIAGLSRHLRVFDPATFLPSSFTDDGQVERGGSRKEDLTCDVGGYIVQARRTDAWEAIVTLLVALDADYPDCFHAIMRGCRRLSDSGREDDGLDNLLPAGEQLLHAMAFDREHRRSRHGHVTPADARAFLELARHGPHRAAAGAGRMNPVAAACLRTAEESPLSGGHDGPAPSGPESTQADRSTEADRLVGLLIEAGAVPERPRALLPGAGEQHDRLDRIRPLLERTTGHDAFLARSREMAFLANALMAGCSVQSRPFTVQEASDAAVGVCNLGLEHWPARWRGQAGGDPTSGPDARVPDTFLLEHDLVTAFEVGWTVLHEDVCLFTARQLLAALREARCIDPGIQSGLDVLRRELAGACRAGTPWRARDPLDAIAMLDVPAWAALLGLLDECPVIPAALTAIVERRIGAVSATEFEFISTRRQFHAITEFALRLPAILTGT